MPRPTESSTPRETSIKSTLKRLLNFRDRDRTAARNSNSSNLVVAARNHGPKSYIDFPDRDTGLPSSRHPNPRHGDAIPDESNRLMTTNRTQAAPAIDTSAHPHNDGRAQSLPGATALIQQSGALNQTPPHVSMLSQPCFFLTSEQGKALKRFMKNEIFESRQPTQVFVVVPITDGGEKDDVKGAMAKVDTGAHDSTINLSTLERLGHGYVGQAQLPPEFHENLNYATQTGKGRALGIVTITLFFHGLKIIPISVPCLVIDDRDPSNEDVDHYEILLSQSVICNIWECAEAAKTGRRGFRHSAELIKAITKGKVHSAFSSARNSAIACS